MNNAKAIVLFVVVFYSPEWNEADTGLAGVP
jgi:hypothetical protein